MFALWYQDDARNTKMGSRYQDDTKNVKRGSREWQTARNCKLQYFKNYFDRLVNEHKNKFSLLIKCAYMLY